MINVWSGVVACVGMVANQFWVSNIFNFASIAFWNKGNTTSFLGRLWSDTYARLGRQICIVLLTTTSGCPWPSDTVKSPGSPSMSWRSCAKKIPGPGSCEAPCVKSRSQNWDPTSWKSRLKSFQVSILETMSVKIQAPKLRSQVLKIMSWKP